MQKTWEVCVPRRSRATLRRWSSYARGTYAGMSTAPGAKHADDLLLKPDLGKIPHGTGSLFRCVDRLLRTLARESSLDPRQIGLGQLPIRVCRYEIVRWAEQIDYSIDWNH